jgi:hypothetical protein
MIRRPTRCLAAPIARPTPSLRCEIAEIRCESALKSEGDIATRRQRVQLRHPIRGADSQDRAPRWRLMPGPRVRPTNARITDGPALQLPLKGLPAIGNRDGLIEIEQLVREPQASSTELRLRAQSSARSRWRA